MTMTTHLSRLFSLVWGRRRSHRTRFPRLESLNLSQHDLADINLPPSYRARLDADRASLTPNQYR